MSRFSNGAPTQIWQVRRVSLQAVGRVSLLFAICFWVALVLAAVLLWMAAGSTGLLENFESFWAEATGQESVALNGSALLALVVFGGLVLVAAITLLHVMCAVLFNSICDLTGGVPVTVQQPLAVDPVTSQAEATRAPSPTFSPRTSSFSSRVSDRVSQLARKWPR